MVLNGSNLHNFFFYSFHWPINLVLDALKSIKLPVDLLDQSLDSLVLTNCELEDNFEALSIYLLTMDLTEDL